MRERIGPQTSLKNNNTKLLSRVRNIDSFETSTYIQVNENERIQCANVT